MKEVSQELQAGREEIEAVYGNMEMQQRLEQYQKE